MKPEMPELRDEVQHRILAAIANHKTIHDAVVFRGGTMLRCYVYNAFRYSEDMDFYVPDGRQSILSKAIAEISENLQQQMSLPKMKFVRNSEGADYILLDENETGGWINLDILPENSQLSMKIEKRTLIGRYPDLNTNIQTSCLSLVDVMATKYNCLANRPEPRDLYDFWILSQNRKLPDESWRKYQKTWNAYDVPVPPEEIFPALRDWENTYKKYWDREAENLRFPVNPGVETIYSNVKNIFKRVCLRDN